MGTDQCTRSRLVARCCHGVFFGFGFVSTILTLTVMFWIVWCYFGLTILQISDSQRRALVNYSYVSAKPLPTPTIAPSRSTTTTTQETSLNSISKSSTTASIIRGSSRGESQAKVDKKKEAAVISNLAKGDFASRDRENQKNATTLPSKDVPVVTPERNSSKKKDAPHTAAAILSGSESDESDDRVYARRVPASGTENRAEEKGESNDRSIRRNPSDTESTPRLDISPTKAYGTTELAGESLKIDDPKDRTLREEARIPPRDYVGRESPDSTRRDDIQSSRRSDPETVYREPDFDREYPKRSATSSIRGSSRFDDFDDERGTRGRYEKRERGRESDDRYSKGDTRVYPDDRILVKSPSTDEERYRDRERYPDDIPRRGDDDRYDRPRNYDEKPRIRDRDDPRYRDRDLEVPISRKDRYKDDDRYRYRDDDRYSDRDDDKYRPRDDDRYIARPEKPDDDRYKSRDDERYRLRDDDKYRLRDDDRYRTRDDYKYRLRDDDRYRYRDDDRYRYRDDERYRSRDDDRYDISDDDKYKTRDSEDSRSIPSRPRVVEEDRYRLRSDDDKYIDSSTSRIRDTVVKERNSGSLPVGDRKPSSSRPQYDIKIEEPITDYDIPVRDRPRLPDRDEINPSRLSRLPYDEDRYRDRDRDDSYRPSRYDEDEIKTISPTRTRDDIALSRSTLVDPKVKIIDDDPRSTGIRRDRPRTDRFYEEDERYPNIRLQGSRSALSPSETSRKYIDEDDRSRTRLPNEKIETAKVNDRREEVVLDHRSYASEEDGEYRKGTSRGRDYYEDRTRDPVDDTRRRYKDDVSYSRREPIIDEEIISDRPRTVNSRDRSRSSYDDEYRRYDDKYISRDEDRYPLRDDRLESPARKYDAYPDDDSDDERTRRRNSEIRTTRIEEGRRNREEIIRPSASSRDEERYYSRDDFPEPKSSPRRRYDEELPDSDDYDKTDRDSNDRRYSGGLRRPVNSRESALGSSMSFINSREPTEVVIREKRYQNSRAIDSERSTDPEPSSKEQVRPLSAKDVIEAAIRHSDNSDQNSRKVHYPVFDPRVSNLTSPEIIRPSERRGTTITAKRRRSV